MKRRALRRNAGALAAPPFWRRGPLIDEDVNTVAHVYWRNGALVDSKSNSWTQNGTVPQVGSSGKVPPGSGAFSDANYYSLGAGADVLDFATGDFTLVIIAKANALGSFWAAMNNSDGSTVGWWLDISNTGGARFVSRPTGLVSAAATITAGVPFVIMCGRSGANIYVRINQGTSVTGGATYATPSAVAAKLGSFAGTDIALNGVIYEFYATTSTPTDALSSAIVSAVSTRMGIPL